MALNLTALTVDGAGVCHDMSLCVPSDGNNVGLAFGLTAAAGLSTTLGSLFPFFVRLDNVRVLAGCLGLSAGVMLYVSFAEILDESKGYFCCVQEKHDVLAATGCFFAGIICMVLLHSLVHSLQHCAARNLSAKFKGITKKITLSVRRQRDAGDHTTGSVSCVVRAASEAPPHLLESATLAAVPSLRKDGSLSANASATDIIEVELEISRRADQINEEMENREDLRGAETACNNCADRSDSHMTTAGESCLGNGRGDACPECAAAAQRVDTRLAIGVDGVTTDAATAFCEDEAASQRIALDANGRALMSALAESGDQACYETDRLKTMGLLTCIAMGIHNFPEGIATFVATLANPSLGYAMCVAIALHNIPEGVCVAMPIYFATGSRRKAFMWAFLSGISEPIGAFLGWIVLKDVFGPAVYGTLFGLIGGMMVFIALRELIPMAHKFDPTDKIVSPCVVIGMFVMAVSLLLFEY